MKQNETEMKQNEKDRMALAALRTNRAYPLARKGLQLAPILKREHEERAKAKRRSVNSILPVKPCVISLCVPVPWRMPLQCVIAVIACVMGLGSGMARSLRSLL